MQKYLSPELIVIDIDKKTILNKDTVLSVGNEPDELL